MERSPRLTPALALILIVPAVIYAAIEFRQAADRASPVWVDEFPEASGTDEHAASEPNMGEPEQHATPLIMLSPAQPIGD